MSFTLCVITPMFICVAEGQQLRYCGIGHKYDDVIIKGNVDELKVSRRACPLT